MTSLNMRGNKFNPRFKAIALIALLFCGSASFAGNPDRIGQAGAPELRINPWARSSGFAGANTASVTGLESMNLNVSGLAFTKKTEMIFSYTNWLSGSDIAISTFGFSQRVGEQGVIGLGIMSMNFGEIEITTVDLPEGGLGTFSPRFLNVGLSYAREFSNSIYGGITLKSISQNISDASASGMAFDAGIRYITGKSDRMKFGIALRNVGPRMKFEGDGFSTKVDLDNKEFTVEQRSAEFELPALLNIGFSYDIYLNATADSASQDLKSDHRITAAGSFTSNSFGKDQIRVGLEYGFKKYLGVRAGFVYEEGIFDADERSTAYTGPTAGVTFEMPISPNGTTFGLDYSYRVTERFAGTHAIGARINL